MASPDQPHSAFFYGTLMAPQVLHRVCHGSTSPSNPIYTTSSLTTKPAILHAHRRHRVRHADYPAILPVPDPASTVRGTYVTGLTHADIWRLDIFEGSEYARRRVAVRVLDVVGDDVSGEGNVEGAEVECETYVWVAGAERLEAREWDFGEFQREKMRYWVGSEGAGGEEGFEGREDIIGKLPSLLPLFALTPAFFPHNSRRLTIPSLPPAEVDEAVAARARAEEAGASGKRDGTGGRGLNGHIASALAEEHRKDGEKGKGAV